MYNKIMHVSYFLGGPLHKKKTETKLNISEQIIFRDKQLIVHLYNKIHMTDNSKFVYYRYVGPAEKNIDGDWIPVSG